MIQVNYRYSDNYRYAKPKILIITKADFWMYLCLASMELSLTQGYDLLKAICEKLRCHYTVKIFEENYPDFT